MPLPPIDQPGWLRYFRRNAALPAAIPWNDPCALTTAEFRRVARSIATFQLGQQSEGQRLLMLARRHAGTVDDPLLVEITGCFVREEQRHAAMLARFMGQQGIPRLERQWTDSAFRSLRKLGGFELSVSVLTTAEVLSLVYYRGLHASTGSQVLRAICMRILADEHAHVQYESQLLHMARQRRGGRSASRAWRAHRAFFVATAGVVWAGHRRVLEAAHPHGGFGAFLEAALEEFALFEAQGTADSPAVSAALAVESALRYGA